MIKKAEIFVLLLLVIFINSSESLRFELNSEKMRCMHEDIKSGSMSVGKYHVVNPNEGHPLPASHKIIASVSNDGNSFHYADRVESGQFSFTADDEGDYIACFYAPDKTQESKVTIDFEWKTGVEAVDWTSIAKRLKLHDIELELKMMEATVESIRDEIVGAYIRQSVNNLFHKMQHT
ncbi:GOLD domain [Dillenia turbinata]|uniref:GOLD domain n=1 Tax=Dillenia turbinata TaxID=194707 RepID=A0AAN8V752_9MAGN